jgi:RNA polymerase sigma factor for flagellar operon FliA
VSRPRPTEVERLILDHLHLVRHLAWRMKHTLPRVVELVDLESAGHIGLVRAAQTWQPEKGVRFSYYCRFRIRGAMLDQLRAMDPLTRRCRAELSRELRAMSPTERHARSHTPDGMDPLSVQAQDHSCGDVEERGPSEILESRELPDGLVRALSERERVVLHMRYVEDMQFQSIAPYLGVSPSRISQIHRELIEKARAWFLANGRIPVRA